MTIANLGRRLVYYSACALAVACSSSLSPTDARAGDHIQAGGCNTCQTSCVDPCGCCPWTVRADALILRRSGSDIGLLFEDVAGDPGDEVFSTDELDTGWAAGPRLALIGCIDQCYSLELGYLGIDGWSDTESRTGDFVVAVPSEVRLGTTVEVDPTQPSTFTYGSDLYSAELNLRRRQAPWLTLISGLRWVELQEEFTANYTAAGLGAQGYSIETNNQLYGTQVGAEMLLLGGDGPWRIDALTKGGIYANNSDSTVREFTTGDWDRGESDEIAFVGEIDLGGTYQLSSNLSFRSGFYMLWLEGVALAPDQSTTANVQPLFDSEVVGVDHGGVFFYGSYVGLEAIW